MTLSEIKTRIKERLDEDAGVSLRYTNANLDEYVFDGVRAFVSRTGCQNATVTITQVANELLYYLPCDLIQVERVGWNDSGGRYVPIGPTTSRELDAMWYKWQHQQDIHARAYFLLGLDRIALWPISPDGGETYTIHYQQDIYNDVALVPVEDHECLVDYGVARCLLSSGQVDGMGEYGRFREAVQAATRRMASPDRVWGMSGNWTGGY